MAWTPTHLSMYFMFHTLFFSPSVLESLDDRSLSSVWPGVLYCLELSPVERHSFASGFRYRLS